MATTIAQTFKDLGQKDHKTKEVLATEIVNSLVKAGITQTKKKNKISKELVLRQINAMSRDINQERKGWWSEFKIVEDKDKFKLVKKA